MTQNLLPLTEHQCVCPAHILGFIKLVANSLSGRIAFSFLWKQDTAGLALKACKG